MEDKYASQKSAQAAVATGHRTKMLQSSLPPPRFVFMEVNKRCNLRCVHCDFWHRTDGDKANYLSPRAKEVILDDFATMNDQGNLVICGGEPMLDLDTYFHLAAACRSRGLRALSVVNGTRIRSADMADRMIAEGPHEISISLNSQRRDLHDRTRGVNGAFDKAVAALRLLVEARARVGTDDPKIYVMGLIYGSNYREIEKFYDFVLNDIGADKLKLNYLQPAFGQGEELDDFFASETAVDPDELVTILRQCDQRFGLGLNPVTVEQIGMYFRSMQDQGDLSKGWRSKARTSDHICNTYERNVMIDHYGVARLCFSHVFPGMQLAEPGDLTNFWQNADEIRADMRQCNRFCGISHSVRKESSTLAGRAKSERHAKRFGTTVPA